jgi:hypothetical protein
MKGLMLSCGLSRHALSAGINASQIWSTQFLEREMFSVPILCRPHTWPVYWFKSPAKILEQDG